MKAQQVNTRIRSGVVAKRRTPQITREAAAPARRTRRHPTEQEQGTSVLWMLMMIGALVAAGFLFALRSQHTVHQLGQAEAQLRNDLDRISLYQRHLALEQQRSLSVRESEQMAKQSGLIQPKLPTAPLAARAAAATTIAAKPATTTKQSTIVAKPTAAPALAKPVATRAKPTAAKTSLVTTKASVKPALAKSSAKPAPTKPAIKTTATTAKPKKQNQPSTSRLAQRR
jgi:hypothetical protein